MRVPTLLLFAVALAITVNSQPSTARIEGCVVDRLNNPMPGVAVELGRYGDWSPAGTTDKHGCFQLEKSIAKGYELRFSLRGFQSVVRSESSASRQDDFGKVTMEVAPISTPIDVPVYPSALSRTLTGRASIDASPIEWEPGHIVAPEGYPLPAGATRIEGTVEVRCELAEDGRVISAVAISGHPVLRAAAVENAKQWQFRQIGPKSALVRREADLIYAFELVGSPVRREPKSRFSFDYPNRVRLTSEPRCADHAPCPTDDPKSSNSR